MIPITFFPKNLNLRSEFFHVNLCPLLIQQNKKIKNFDILKRVETEYIREALCAQIRPMIFSNPFSEQMRYCQNQCKTLQEDRQI